MLQALTNEALLARSLDRARELTDRDAQAKSALSEPEVAARILREARRSIEYFAKACEAYAQRPALGYRVPDEREYRTLSYAELWDRVASFATGARSGDWARKGDRVAICGFAGPDYVVAEFACLYLGATAVPLQTNMNLEDLRLIINEAELASLVVSTEQLGQIEAVLPHCPTVRSVIVFDVEEHDRGVRDFEARLEALQREALRRGCAAKFTTLLGVEREGRQRNRVPYALPEPGSNPLMALFYTSGSTGLPKGAMFPEDIWALHWRRSLSVQQSVSMRHASLPFIGFCFMPLNHLAGQHLLTDCLMRGGLLNFTLKSDMSTLFEDIRLCRPTSLFLVPRVSEMIFQSYQSELVRRAGTSEPTSELKEEVLEEMRDGFLGDRLLTTTTGTAPTSDEVLDFLKRCFQVPVFDGFGSTEAGMISFEGKIAWDAIDAYKLADVPELGYHLTDKPYPRGELRVKTKRAIPGYLKNPDATRDLFDEEGYLRTGDIVEERGRGEVHWIDRQKNILKLSQGEFVSLWRLEAMYAGGSAFIKQAYLYGTSLRSYLVGVIVVGGDAVKAHFGRDAAPDEVKELLRGELNRIAKANQLRGYEIPRDFVVEKEPFSKENGLLTESNKPARAKLKARYGKSLEGIYEDLERNQRNDLLRLRADRSLPIAEKVRRALAANLGVPDIDLSQALSFVELGGDSLNAVALSSLVQELTGVAVPVGFILNPSSHIADLAAYAEQVASGARGKMVTFEEVHGAGATTVRAEDLRLDKFLSSEELAAASSLPRASAPPRIVFLTGANGFLGRFLTLELLEQLPLDGKAYCLVRAGSPEAAHARLREGFEEGHPRLLDALDRLSHERRLVPLPGDLMKPRFGLGDEIYARLASEVDVLFHNGALVNHAFSYPQLFEPNVLGTVEIARLALTGKLKSVSFVSSVGVAAGVSRTGVICEEEDALALGRERPVDSGYAVGYSTTKWAGEILMRELGDRFGIPLDVFRCGMILPHSEAKGQINTSDFFTRLLCGVVYTGIAPSSFYLKPPGVTEAPHFDGLPVDFIARSLVRRALAPEPGYATYHVLSHWEDGVSLDTIVDWVRTAGYPVDRIGDYDRWYRLFGERLRALDETRRQRSPLPILYQWSRPTEVGREARFDVSRFEKEAGKLPPLTETYIHKVLGDLQRLGYIEPPGEA